MIKLFARQTKFEMFIIILIYLRGESHERRNPSGVLSGNSYM